MSPAEFDNSTSPKVNSSAMATAPGGPAKPVGRDPQMYAPVFILAPARSYSSVVAAMIGQHPQLYGFPELNLFQGDTLGETMAFLPPNAHWQRAGLLRVVAERTEGEQTLEAIRRARAWVKERAHWRVESVFDCLLADVFPRIGVEKSPLTCSYDSSLARVWTLYPRARFIHLVRHPLAAIKSMESHYENARWLCERDELQEFAADTWYTCHRRILLFADTLDAKRVFRIRGEDVLSQPGETLREIAAWIGVRTDKEAMRLMRHPERSAYARLGPRGAVGGNDPKFLADPRLRRPSVPTSCEIPIEWKINPRLKTVISRLARHLGYA